MTKIGIIAAGKGVRMANIIDPNHEIIECLIDLNPKKCGKFIPGTGHEIINFSEIEKRKIKTAIVMNPNYYNEIKKLIKEQNLDIILMNSGYYKENLDFFKKFNIEIELLNI